MSNNEIKSDTIIVEKLTSESQKVKVQVSSWGIFTKAIAIASHRKKTFKKTAILGGFFDSEKDPNLFLAETYNPLTLVGNTQIKGYALLPTLGVRPGYIAGESYYGSQLIYGKSDKSHANLPKLIPETDDLIEFYLTNNQIEKDNFANLIPNEKLFNSFKNTTKYVFSKEEIQLDKVIIVGNIIIKSDTKIKVSRFSDLKDVIIVAPEVEIEDNVEGVFQVIASKKITIGKHCKLNYPSALVLQEDSEVILNNKEENIFIDKESLITGVVCYLNAKNSESDFNTNIVLEENSRVKGQVYCQGSFELKGKVSGAVYTKQFVANQAGSIFVNHIYNGIIENETIPQEFGGILFENKTKKVVKWLY